MPRTIEVEPGLSFDFADDATDEHVLSWLDTNVYGKEEEIRKTALKTELEALNTDTPEYGVGMKLWQGIGSIADGFFGSIMAMPESLARFTNYMMNDVASIAPGVTLGGMLTKAAGVNPYELVADKMKSYREGLHELTDIVPSEALTPLERFYLEAVPQGLGSALTFMTGGASLKGLMSLSKYGPGTVNQMRAVLARGGPQALRKFMQDSAERESKAAVATLGAFSMYSDGYNRAIEAGETVHTANFMGLLNSGVGLTEAFPLGKFLDRLGGRRGATLGEVIKEGGEEFAQEFFQTAMGDFIAAMGKEDLDLTQTLADAAYSGAAGFMVGGGLSAATSFRAGRSKDEQDSDARNTILGPPTEPIVPPTLKPLKDIEETTEPSAEEDVQKTKDEQPFTQLRQAFGGLPPMMGPVTQRREAGAEVLLKSDYGVKEAVQTQMQEAGLVIPVAGPGVKTNAINGEDLDLLLRATTESLAPQNMTDELWTQEGLADLNKTGNNYTEASVNTVGQAGTQNAERINSLLAKHQLGEYLKAIRGYIKAADLAGETQQAERLRAMTAELLGFTYNREAVESPAGFNYNAIRQTVESDEKRTNREYAQGAYPEGTTVEIDTGIGGGTVVDGRVIGYYTTNDQDLGLRVQTASGQMFRVPARKSRVKQKSRDPGARYSSPLVPLNVEVVPGQKTETQTVTDAEERINRPEYERIEDDTSGDRELAESLPAVEPEPESREYLKGKGVKRPPFGQTWQSWQLLGPGQISPAAWVDVAESFVTQNTRETALSDDELNIIEGSLGLPYSLTREESLQKIQLFREAMVASQEGLADLAARPIEQLRAMLQLVGQRPRTNSKVDLAKRIKKADFPGRNKARYEKARKATFFKSLEDVIDAGHQIEATTLYSAMQLDEARAEWLLERYMLQEEAREADWVPIEAFEDYPEMTLRPGERKLVKSGSTIPAKLDGYKVVDGVITPSVTFVGNWQTEDGLDLNHGSSTDWTARTAQRYGITPIIYSEETGDHTTYAEAVELAYRQLGTAVEAPMISGVGGNVVEEVIVHPITYARLKDSTEEPRTRGEKVKKIPARKKWLGAFTTETAANLSNDRPVYIKPIYPPGVRKSKTRLGFAEVGYSARDTDQLTPDALAKKHDANLKRAVQPTTKVREGKRLVKDPDVEIFRPAVFVVMYNQHGDPIGHYRFHTVSKAKAYLSDKLEAEGVGTQVVRVRKSEVKELPKGYRRLPKAEQDAGADYVKVRTPTYQATTPMAHSQIEKNRKAALDQAARTGEAVDPSTGRLGGKFSLGAEGQVPLVKSTVRVASRPDWGEFRVVGPVHGFPGLLRVSNVRTHETLDISAHNLTGATESLPGDIQAMAQKGSTEREAVNIAPRGDERVKPLSLADKAHQIATQVPLEMSFDQLITMSESELNQLAESEAFSNPTLLGLRIGRNIRTVVDLDTARQAATNRQSPIWNAAVMAATGVGTGNQFNLMASDPGYSPRFEAAQPMPEGFTPQSTDPNRPGIVDPNQPGGVPARGEPTPGTEGLAAEEQFRKDVRDSTDLLDKSPYMIKRNMRTAPNKYKRIVNSRLPLNVPASSFEQYSLDDMVDLGIQEGSGFVNGAAYRVGRNMGSVLEFQRMLNLRHDLWNQVNEGLTEEQVNNLKVPSVQVMRDAKMLRNWINRNNPGPNQMALIKVKSFVDPALEAATGQRADLSYADKLELWDDPSYKPPLDCASPCVVNPDPQPNDQQNPPPSTATPDVNANQPPTDELPEDRRKPTTALKRALLDPEFRAAHPIISSTVLPTLEAGTYVPRGDRESEDAARQIVDQYDTGLDGLRELAQVSMSIRPEDRWWNIDDSLKPLVLMEIVTRLRSYDSQISNPILKRTIDDLQGFIWHDIQMLGSFGGRLLHTYRIIADKFTPEFMVDTVIRQMFEKAGQLDDFNRIQPELMKFDELLQAMPEGMPKNRIRQQRNRLIDRTINHNWADKFWSMWYNNVLSGTRTQLDNLTMSFNLLFETAAQMVVKPGNAHRAFGGALRGFINGWRAFGQIVSGDYSQRISNAPEQEAELSKDSWFGRDHLIAWRESGNPILKLLGSTRVVTNFMSAIDNVVSMGGFELRVQTLAYQKAMEKMKEGKVANITPEMIEKTMNEILHTSPTDVVRYKKQVEEEIANPSIPIEAKDRDARLRELKRLGYPEDIYEDARQYGKSVAGNREPYGWIGYMHRIITNARGQPGALGFTTRMVFPFTRWAANWTNIIMDYMPPTALARMFIHSPNWEKGGRIDKLAKKLLVNGDKRMDPNEYNMLRFKAGLGSLFGMSVWAAFSHYDDEDDPPIMITGGLYNVTPGRRNTLRERGIHPWSIVVGNQSVSYRNLPIAGALGVVGNIKDGDRFGATDDWKLNAMNAVWRGGLLVKDMSVMSGFSELLDVLTDNRLSSEVRSRSLVSWFGRFAGGVPIPYANFIKDADGWFNEAFDKPVHYTPNNNMGMFFRDWPGMNNALNEPTLNVLGEPINMSRAPWSRQVYPRRDDPVWEAIGHKALQGVFIPDIRAATKVDPKTGDRVKMTRTELNKYRAAVYKRMGDVVKQNYVWWRDADPEFAQLWISRQANYVRRWVRYELNLR